MQTHREPPTAQPTWPLIGALPSMARNLSAFIQTNCDTHGDIYTIRVAGQKLVMLTHPRHVEHVKVRSADIYHTGKGNPAASLVFPDGIVTTDGQQWRDRRAPLQPYFKPPHLDAKFAAISDSIHRGLHRLDAAVDTDEGCNLKAVTSYLTMGVLIETIFGVEAKPAEMRQIKASLDFVITEALKFVAHGRLPGWVPMPGRQESQQAMQTFRAIAEGLMARQQAENTEANSVFNTLQNLSLTDGKQSDKRVMSQTLELLLAGYETTSSTLFWIISLLIANPDVLAKVTQEIDVRLGTQPPTQEDLMNLPYLKMVISEVLRLYPTVYLFWQRCMKEDVIDDYRITEGAIAILSSYHVHRHPEFWDEPDVFNPERFAPDNAKPIAPHAFIPFGIGARKCLGHQFALMELQIAIVRIIQQYSLAFMPGYGVPEAVLGAALSPSRDVMVAVSRRNTSMIDRPEALQQA